MRPPTGQSPGCSKPSAICASSTCDTTPRRAARRTTSFTRNGWYTRREASTCGPSCRHMRSCERLPWERVRRVSLQEQTFTAIAELDTDPFKHSMGAYRGVISKVQVRFHPRIAPYIKERSWHPSQRLKDRTDGSLVLTMEVSDDYILGSWILSLGRSARVLAPASLVEWISEELDQAGRQYHVSAFAPMLDDDVQPGLPFLFERRAGT